MVDGVQADLDVRLNGGHLEPSVGQPREQYVRHPCHAVPNHIDNLGVQHVATQQKLFVLQRQGTAVDDEGIDRSHVPQLDAGVFE